MEVSIKKKLHMEVDLPDLPSHIISFEILTRLPAKSLMRFKCVCKFWSSSLFRDPLFVKAHQKRYNQNNKTTHLFHSSRLLSIQVNPELGFTKIPSPANILTRTPMTSSNGLICLISVPVRILNPCTRESTTLPVSQFQLGRHPFHTYQIGFSPLTNEYKILHVHSYPSKTSPPIRFMFEFEIFTLGSTSKSWRHVPAICFDDLDVQYRGINFYRNKHTLCIHGALHWGASNKKGQHTILAFDVGEERFRVIPLPHQDYRTSTFTDLIEVNGCVAIFGSASGPQMMDLWILKDYQNQVWVKENQVWVKESIEFPDDRDKLGRPVPACTLNTGELLLFPRLSEGEVHVYDIKSKSYQRTKIRLPNGFLASYDEYVVPLR